MSRYDILGSVVDSNGDAINGATVTVNNEFKTVTRIDGRFNIKLEPGVHVVEVKTTGFESIRKSVLIREGLGDSIYMGMIGPMGIEQVDDLNLSTEESDKSPEPINSWTFKDESSWVVSKPRPEPDHHWKAEMRTAVGYYGSEYDYTDEAWNHDFIVVSTASTECENEEERSKATKDNYLEKTNISFSSDDVYWKNSTKDEHSGVWPVGDDEDSTPLGLDGEDFATAKFVANLAITRLNPTIGFALKAADFLIEVESIDAETEVEGDLTMSHNPQACSLGGYYCQDEQYQEMGHYMRVDAMQECDRNSWCEGSLTLETGFQVDFGSPNNDPHLSVKQEFEVVSDPERGMTLK